MWNIDEVHRRHEWFLAENERLIVDAEEVAGRHAVEQVHSNPQFKPRTGETQAKATYRIVRLGSGRILRIADTAKQANILEYGSRAHWIYPKQTLRSGRVTRGSALRFVGRDGSVIFRRRVHHPGTRPYKFLYKATTSAFRVLGQELTRRMDDAASRF